MQAISQVHNKNPTTFKFYSEEKVGKIGKGLEFIGRADINIPKGITNIILSIFFGNYHIIGDTETRALNTIKDYAISQEATIVIIKYGNNDVDIYGIPSYKLIVDLYKKVPFFN